MRLLLIYWLLPFCQKAVSLNSFQLCCHLRPTGQFYRLCAIGPRQIKWVCPPYCMQLQGLKHPTFQIWIQVTVFKFNPLSYFRLLTDMNNCKVKSILKAEHTRAPNFTALGGCNLVIKKRWLPHIQHTMFTRNNKWDTVRITETNVRKVREWYQKMTFRHWED